MRLEPLGTMRLQYDDDGLIVVRPFAGHEGQGYGTGTGSIVGERLSGRIRWANYPRVRDDGVLMPDVRGLIATDEGPVLMEFHGYSLATDREAIRAVVSSITFRTDVTAHRWLNDVIAVHEGHIDFTDMSTQFPVHVVVPEAP